MAAVVVLLCARSSALHGQVRIVSDQPDYAALAAAAAPKLAEIESSLRSRRVTIEAEAAKGPVTAGEVKELLDWVEGQMFTALEPDELAPLRASIQLRFERLRRQLEAASGEGGGFAFASFRAARASSGGLLSLEEIVSLLEAADAVLQRVKTLAEDRHFSLRLCVVSQPRAGAMFHMRPPGYPPGVKEGPTVLNREVGRGRYVYLAEEQKGKNREIECGWKGNEGARECLDLWDTSGDQLYSCNFDERACTLRDLPRGGCP
jgi:hypothetical protein